MPGRCVIVGSVRRQKAECGDAEVLCVPRTVIKQLSLGIDGDLHYLDGAYLDRKILELIDDGRVTYRLNSKGSKVYGPKNKLLTHVNSSFPVDIFSTTEECWAMSMVIRTGPKASNIRLAIAAKKKGWRLNAYGSGFTKMAGYFGIKVICKTEREVFEAVDLEYQEPGER